MATGRVVSDSELSDDVFSEYESENYSQAKNQKVRDLQMFLMVILTLISHSLTPSLAFRMS
jgi:hypothetical protein